MEITLARHKLHRSVTASSFLNQIVAGVAWCTEDRNGCTDSWGRAGFEENPVIHSLDFQTWVSSIWS